MPAGAYITDPPDWATSGDNIVDPNRAKRLRGWLPGEYPPAQYLNYALRRVNTALADLDGALDGQVGARTTNESASLIVPAALGFADPSAAGFAVDSLYTVSGSNNGGIWLVPVPIITGMVIEELRVRCIGQTGSTLTLGAVVMRDGSAIVTSSGFSGANNSAWETVTINSGAVIGHNVQAADQLFVVCTAAGGGSSNRSIQSVEIDAVW